MPAQTANSALGLGFHDHDEHTVGDIYSWLFEKDDPGYFAHWQEDDLIILLDEAPMLDEVMQNCFKVMDMAVEEGIRTKRIRFVLGGDLYQLSAVQKGKDGQTVCLSGNKRGRRFYSKTQCGRRNFHRTIL